MSEDDSKLDSLLRKVGKAPPRQPDAHLVDEQRYELGALLGEGSFGAVYEAYDRRHERPIALKILRRTSSEALLRFKREFRVLAELSDPSLAALYDLHGEGERWYFTMERIVGVPFDEWVRDPDRLRPSLAALGDALSRLHARGVVHRDLKPSNVLVDGSGRVVLLDFGLLHLLDTEGSTVIAGTPSTIAPEVAAGRAPSPASDWYAVGVMLHEALTGVAPFAGTAEEVLRQKQGAAPPSVRTRAEAAPRDLAELCDRLLDPNPVTRSRVLGIEVPGVARAPFVGRVAELEALDRALRECPSVVRVFGSSGIGKTALVQRFAERARDAGARVLSSRCHLRDHVPFVALDGVIDELARLLSRLPPAHARAIAPRDADALVRAFPVLRAVPGFDRPAGRDGARARIAVALGELLGRWGDRAPWVVIIDDAQWGDADSAAVLRDLVRDRAVPLCLVLVHRRDGQSPLIDAFADAGVIDVRPLDHADARALLGEVTESDDVDAIVRDAGGHPLFLIELARARAGSDDKRSFAELVRGRMAALGAVAARGVRMLAIAASPVPIAVLAQAGVTRASVEALREQGFVVFPDDETVAIYHDRIRDVVHEIIDADAARGLHRDLAVAMESLAPERAEALAFHFEAAGMLERAASHLRRAATDATATRAFAQARSIYARLLGLRELAAIHDGQDLELREEAAMASARAGMSVEAAEGFLACAHLAGPERALGLRVRAGELLLDSGHRERGEAILDGELAQLGTSIPTTDVGRVLGVVRDTVGRRFDRLRPRPTSEQRLSLLWTACRSAMSVHPVRATSLAMRFMREAERPGTNAHARLAAAFLRGMGEVGPRGPLALPTALGGIERAFEDRSDPALAQLHAISEGLLLYFGFEVHRSRASFDRCVRIGVEHGLGRTFEETFARCLESSTAWVLGDIDSMRAKVPSLCAELDERDHLLGWIVVEMHRIWLEVAEHGFTPAWDATVERIRGRWRSRGPELQGWFLDIGEIYKALTLRNGRAAWKLSLPQARRFQERVFSTLFHRVEAQTFLVRAGIQIALQERTLPRAELARCHEVIEEMAELPSAWTRAHSLCLGAGLASVEGDRAGAVRSLRAALPNLQEAGMPNMLALAEIALGRLVGGDEGRALEAGTDERFRRWRIRREQALACALPGTWCDAG